MERSTPSGNSSCKVRANPLGVGGIHMHDIRCDRCYGHPLDDGVDVHDDRCDQCCVDEDCE
eukprot:2651883-Rhodomonas_salina.3